MFCQCTKEIDVEQILTTSEICLENPLTDSLTLSNHLIGTWELVYYESGSGESNNKVTGDVIFESGKGVLDLSNQSVEFEWTIEVLTWGNKETSYFLKTEPYLLPLVVNGNICENYMEQDGRFGNWGYHLFKKL